MWLCLLNVCIQLEIHVVRIRFTAAIMSWHQCVIDVVSQEQTLQRQTDNSPRIMEILATPENNRLQCISLLCSHLTLQSVNEIVVISHSNVWKMALFDEFRRYFHGFIVSANSDMITLANGSKIAYIDLETKKLRGIGANIVIWNDCFDFTDPKTAAIIHEILIPLLEVNGTMSIQFRSNIPVNDWFADVARDIWDLCEPTIAYTDANAVAHRVPIKILRYAKMQVDSNKTV